MDNGSALEYLVSADESCTTARVEAGSDPLTIDGNYITVVIEAPGSWRGDLEGLELEITISW